MAFLQVMLTSIHPETADVSLYMTSSLCQLLCLMFNVKENVLSALMISDSNANSCMGVEARSD